MRNKKQVLHNQNQSNITVEISLQLRAESRAQTGLVGKARLSGTEGEADKYTECQKDEWKSFNIQRTQPLAKHTGVLWMWAINEPQKEKKSQ